MSVSTASAAAPTAERSRREPRPGSARSALRHRAFRRVWAGTMATQVGALMQNVALGALAYELTESASFVALVGFVQLGPILILSTVGGTLADRFDRRRLVLVTQCVQMCVALSLAIMNAGDSPPRAALLAAVLVLGSAHAIAGPSISSYLPTLVPRADLPGAVSLFSVQMNLARVIGPAIGGTLLKSIDFSGVFLLNAVMPLFAMVAVSTGPPPPRAVVKGTVVDRLLGGFRIAKRDPLVRGVVLSIATFSLVCLPFVGLMPVVAERNLGVDVKASSYGLLYACFGIGAALGAAAVGSVLVGIDRQRVVRGSLLLFASLLAVWALVRTPALGYPTLVALGASYFTITTSWATTLQEHLDDAVRGRVMALYMMGFGGTVPIGLLLFGSLAEVIGLTPILLMGAGCAVAMAAVVHLRREPVAGGLDVHSPEPEAAVSI